MELFGQYAVSMISGCRFECLENAVEINGNHIEQAFIEHSTFCGNIAGLLLYNAPSVVAHNVFVSNTRAIDHNTSSKYDGFGCYIGTFDNVYKNNGKDVILQTHFCE